MSLLKRSALVAATVAGLTLALAAPAAAHVSVNPDTAIGGEYSKVTFRMPNEMDTAGTTKLEINFPTDAPVASVSVKPIPGWTAATVKAKLATPLEAHGAQITEAVSKVTWTAQPDAAVKPGEFQEFDVSMGPLPASGQMIFKALQTYSDGTVVRWIDEPTADGAEPESPAPVLKITPAADAPAPGGAEAPAATAEATTSAPETESNNGLGIAGLIAGILALLLAAAAFVRSGRTTPATAASGATPAAASAATAPTTPATAPAPAATPAAPTAKPAADTTPRQDPPAKS